jgi:hypothetical protein
MCDTTRRHILWLTQDHAEYDLAQGEVAIVRCLTSAIFIKVMSQPKFDSAWHGLQMQGGGVVG